MVGLRDFSRGLNNLKRKKDDSDSNTDYRPPATDKLKKCIVESLTSKIKDPSKLPLVLFILDDNRHEKKGWIRKFIPTSSFPSKGLSKEERNILFYVRTVFKVIEILEDGEEEDISEIPNDFFVASKGGVLPIEMAEIYNLLRWRTTPESFRGQIDNDDALGNVSKPRAKHI
jgi:hypothetical protein